MPRIRSHPIPPFLLKNSKLANQSRHSPNELLKTNRIYIPATFEEAMNLSMKFIQYALILLAPTQTVWAASALHETAPPFPVVLIPKDAESTHRWLAERLASSFILGEVKTAEKNPTCCVWLEVTHWSPSPGTPGYVILHQPGGTFISASSIKELGLAVDRFIGSAESRDGRKVVPVGLMTDYPSAMGNRGQPAQVSASDQPVSATPSAINLARTSLASVSTSSVNGDRETANVYYGIRNAFDDGNNWYEKINYTYWLSDPGDLEPRVEISFDVPVSINSIVVESGPLFSTMFVTSDGAERHCAATKSILTMKEAIENVRKVRLVFQKPKDDVQVHEIRVMGIAPRMEFSVGTPRILKPEETQRTSAKRPKADL